MTRPPPSSTLFPYPPLSRSPADPAAFRAAAAAAKWKLKGPKKGFLVQGDDRVGAVAEVLGRLAAAKINVTATDAVDRKSTRLNSSHLVISYAVFCLKKKKIN